MEITVTTPNAITWLFNIFGKDKGCLMSQDNGYPHAIQSFLGRSRTTRTCFNCNETYLEGALDFLSDEFKCPSCENGKDEE